MNQTIVLRDITDELGQRLLTASISESGDLVIKGLDVGEGVSQVFGEDVAEYEWGITIKKADFPSLQRALDIDDSSLILLTLEKQYSNDDASKLSAFIDENQIPHESWSRMGD